VNGSESRSVTDDLVEYGRELVVVPRLCEHCLAHTAVVLWIGTWPDTYYCRCCYEEMAVELNAASSDSNGRPSSASWDRVDEDIYGPVPAEASAREGSSVP